MVAFVALTRNIVNAREKRGRWSSGANSHRRHSSTPLRWSGVRASAILPFGVGGVRFLGGIEMAHQACRVEACTGGFDFEPYEMHMGEGKACSVCGTVHKFDDTIGHWTPVAKEESAT